MRNDVKHGNICIIADISTCTAVDGQSQLFYLYTEV